MTKYRIALERYRWRTIFIFLILNTLLGFRIHGQSGNNPQVWFTPNVGSVDMLDLFSDPTQWDSARAKVDVFKFNADHVNSWLCNWCDTNTLSSLVNVQAFSKLKQWNIDIAIEIAPPLPQGVYPTQCSLEHQLAVQRAYNWTVDAITNVESNGGVVDYLIIDEPIRRWYSKFFSTGGPACQIDNVTDIAAFVSTYVGALQTTYPSIEIGQFILYPEVDVDEIKSYVLTMENLGTPLSFIHLDVHGARIHEYGTAGGIKSLSQVRSDLRDLESFFNSRNIAFAPVLIDLGWNTQYWLYGDYDNQTYYDGTIFWINQVKQAISNPDHYLFQSWVSPYYLNTSLLSKTFPINLPDNDTTIYSHTRLILDGCNILNSPIMGFFNKQQNLPEGFALQQNYPNPFTHETTITFSVVNPSEVQIKIYNTLGLHVLTLVDEQKSTGEYQVSWNGRNEQGLILPGGVYVYSISVDGQVLRKRLVILR